MPIHSLACDMCGSYLGITPYGNQSSIGLTYRYRAFNGYHMSAAQSHLFPDGHLRNANQNNQLNHHDESSAVLSDEDYEIYRAVELRAKYYIHKRIEFNAVVPLKFNSMKMNNELIKAEGIGDISLFAAFHLVASEDESNFTQRLAPGIGIKLPVGNNNVYYNEQRADAMIQPGTGTTDWFLYANYFAGKNNFGINLTGTYKFNGTNNFNEEIKNSTVIFTSLFYKFIFSASEFTIVPKVNSYYELTKGLYRNNELVAGTPMNVLLMGPALDLFWKNLQLTATLELPVYEKEYDYALKNSCNINLGIIYNFTQTKHLIK